VAEKFNFNKMSRLDIWTTWDCLAADCDLLATGGGEPLNRVALPGPLLLVLLGKNWSSDIAVELQAHLTSMMWQVSHVHRS